MRYLTLIIFLLFSQLAAEQITFDPASRSIEMPKPRKNRVDTFDFTGDYPELENISINARKKKHVEFNLTGVYPQLERVLYEGSFGVLNGKITGHFPKLAQVTFNCSNCAMDFDLKAEWEKSCDIFVRGADFDIVLDLPKDVGLIIHTKTSLKGKVYPFEALKKMNRFGCLNKTFQNDLAESAPIVLTITIEAGDARIVLN